MLEPWIAPLEAGDPERAWDLFVERYRRLIFGAIRHYTGEPDDVMDVFARVCEALRENDFARLRRCAAHADPNRPLSTWLVAVVHNLTIDWFRHRDGRRRLSTIAAALPPLRQRIFEYVFVDGRSHVEAYELLRSREAPNLPFGEFLTATWIVLVSERSRRPPINSGEPMASPSRYLASFTLYAVLGCAGDTGPAGPPGPPGQIGESGPALGYLEDTRVVFPRSELTVYNPSGVLLNLVATNGHVGIRFYKDFDFGNEQQTNPWHMGFIEGVKGYQGLAILRDWLFTSALWDSEGRLTVGRLHPHPPANAPATARFEVRGLVDEVQAMVNGADGQTADIFKVGGNGRTHLAVSGAGRTVVGSPSQPQHIVLYDTVDGAPYALSITNGQLSITKLN